MSCLSARTGRQRQRYEGNLRLVSGCIPYRWIKDSTDQTGETAEMIQVLMVSSPKRDDLVFPKGGWEDDETVTEAASREALEEAGVKGILREIPLGIWEFRSKSNLDLCCLEGGCKGYMFAMEVTEELDAWPEQENRSRQWLNIKQAFSLSRYEWMRSALEEFLKVMAEDRKLEKQDEDNIASPSSLLADVSESQSLAPPKCYKRSSTMPHHSMSSKNNILSCASQEIAINFSF
ncbi:Nucleoside diphosphate-linked moiety X motif 13 [Stylosanthes scabra]|uniref:Nucleoside diphosphate-linked moiety X motif 13 n=2 Tax=Stylosanthes scabra TaxID=79078 RepID=A0ABU6RPM2_9FABA|nr:Nucleoside diphosphate-linked moiety X motif 13 [Stylosanthes scabra]